jgi:acylphosphatase
MRLKKIEAVISGSVQGVGFRYFVLNAAELLGITGWVANLADGGVKTVGVGEEEDIKDFLIKLRQGPPLSYVEDVKVSIQDVFENEFSTFEVTFN